MLFNFFHSPSTVLDAINTAKVITGCILVLLATRSKRINFRKALYLSLHGTYLCWWFLEQWLLPSLATRFGQPTNPFVWVGAVLVIGCGYSYPAYNAFRNTLPISPFKLSLCIVLFSLGSLLNTVSFSKRRERASPNGNTVVDIYITPLSFNPIDIVFVTISS